MWCIKYVYIAYIWGGLLVKLCDIQADNFRLESVNTTRNDTFLTSFLFILNKFCVLNKSIRLGHDKICV
ncbi:hypothetical protein Hanom_Chr14g01325251 [Helianthus anomalus]